MTLKKHKLSVSIDENYCLLGILSDEPDYKLCWLINDKLKMAFAKSDDLPFFNKKTASENLFSMFIFDDENAMLTYRFIRNRSESACFLSDLVNLDYVLHIQGDLIPDDLDTLVSKLNSLKEIRMCVPVDLGKLKDRDRLQLW